MRKSSLKQGIPEVSLEGCTSQIEGHSQGSKNRKQKKTNLVSLRSLTACCSVSRGREQQGEGGMGAEQCLERQSQISC